MTRPAAWSYTALSDFTNCPKQFYHKRVLKDVREEQSEQMLWGNQVHKAFEMFVGHGQALPDMLKDHKPYLTELAAQGTERFTEKKVALNLRGQPCGFFDKDVWWRGVLDYHCIDQSVVDIVDYKTGKRKPDFRQLHLFALWVFLRYPHVGAVRMRFYWTQDKAEDKQLAIRPDVPKMWSPLVQDLRGYVRAFKDDVWPAKPSGLCNGWCPVRSCQHWKPKRSR